MKFPSFGLWQYIIKCPPQISSRLPLSVIQQVRIHISPGHPIVIQGFVKYYYTEIPTGILYIQQAIYRNSPLRAEIYFRTRPVVGE